ncbi:hypothetical protein ABZ897_19940 [Nonomuraea sp. NPDC046802]|uniref:hypothetical protein n=1 Tax=Nonomuraea sp. NPDC046802 TaxID=3154919 RepID=UPI0033E05FEC
MKVCFHGTAEEIELVAGRSVLVMLTVRDLPRVRAFEVFHTRISRHPYQGLYRLCAELAETEGADHA